jgi:molecular chaperone DnaJ
MLPKTISEKDLYKVLGVGKKATTSEIKKKYRALARDLHPDKTKGDSVKEEKFKAVSEAYEILCNPETRTEYDEARSFSDRGDLRAPSSEGFQSRDFANLFTARNQRDTFADIFSSRSYNGSRKGLDIQAETTITFRESIYGTTLNLRLESHVGKMRNIVARVPAGIADGESIRIKGKGGMGETSSGDLLIKLHVSPHPVFSRKDENLTMTLPVTFTEATLGADIKVPTISGDTVTLRIKRGTPTGRTLRIKGHGVTKGGIKGDLLVALQVQIPERVEGKALLALEEFAKLTSSGTIREDLFTLSKV